MEYITSKTTHDMKQRGDKGHRRKLPPWSRLVIVVIVFLLLGLGTTAVLNQLGVIPKPWSNIISTFFSLASAVIAAIFGKDFFQAFYPWFFSRPSNNSGITTPSPSSQSTVEVTLNQSASSQSLSNKTQDPLEVLQTHTVSPLAFATESDAPRRIMEISQATVTKANQLDKKCQVPEKLNIKIRVNKGQLADHDLWHSDQATVDLTLRVAGLDYKN